MKTQVGPLDHVLGGNLDPPGVGAILVWRGNGMINVDLYSTVITKVSNALNTLVSGEKPGNLGVVYRTDGEREAAASPGKWPFRM